MCSKNQKRFYTPQFSEVSCIAVRRLAWSLEKSMPQTVDLIIRLLPFFMDASKVCLACRDKSKCQKCLFSQHSADENAMAILSA
jgi:hypothetical protein